MVRSDSKPSYTSAWRLLRGLWVLLATAVIGSAVLITLTREGLPHIEKLVPSLQEFVLNNTGIEMRVEGIRGEWPGLSPEVRIDTLRFLEPGTDLSALEIDGLVARLDLYGSILHRGFVWRELSAERITLSMVENAEGHWALAGRTIGQRKTSPDLLLRSFVYSSRVQAETAQVALHFYSGTSTVVTVDAAQIQNQGDFHRLTGTMAIESMDQPAQLVIEGRGDPLDRETFTARGYVNIDHFHFNQPMRDFVQALVPGVGQRLQEFSTDLDGEFWFELQPGGRASMVGTMSADEIPLDWAGDFKPLKEFSTDVTGWYHWGEDWGLTFQNLFVDWGQGDSQPVSLQLRQGLGARWQQVSATLNTLDLDVVQRVLSKMAVDQKQLQALGEQLRPSGSISGLTMSMDFARGLDGLTFSANFNNVSFDSYRNAPAARNLAGFISWRGSEGQLIFTGDEPAEIKFPTAYDHFFTIEHLRGKMRWTLDDDALRLSGSRLSGVADGAQGTGAFSLYQPLKVRNQAELMLAIGVVGFPVERHQHYLPDTVAEQLREWLAQAAVAGTTDLGLLYRDYRVDNDAFDRNAYRSTQLYFDSREVELRFQPEWPAVHGMAAEVIVDDRMVEGRVAGATIGDVPIRTALVSIDTALDDAALDIRLEANGALNSFIDVLRQSPLKADTLFGWQYAGDAEAAINLQIPLRRNSADAMVYQVDAKLVDAALDVTDTPVALTALNGRITVGNRTGIVADQVAARLWGRPITFDAKPSGGVEHIGFRSTQPVTVLDRFLAFSWEEVMAGELDLWGEVVVDGLGGGVGTAPYIVVNSDLEQVAIDLPLPIGKPVDESRELALKIEFEPNSTYMRGAIGETIAMEMAFSEGALDRGVVALNEAPMLPESGIFQLQGVLWSFDVGQWQPFFSLLGQRDADAGATAAGSRSKLDFRFVVQTERMRWGNYLFENMIVGGSFEPDELVIKARSPLLAGELGFPINAAEGTPIRVDLSRLYVPEIGAEGEQRAESFNPADIAAVDVQIADFRYKGEEVGDLSFRLRPTGNGLQASDIVGSLFGLSFKPEHNNWFNWSRVIDSDSYPEAVAEPELVLTPIDLLVSNSAADDPTAEGVEASPVEPAEPAMRDVVTLDLQTSFGNFNQLVERFDYPKLIDSKQGEMRLALTWPGKPWEFDQAKAQGNVQLKMASGKVYRAPSGAANATIKLVSLVNFANWLKRLQLDFSDVLESELAYDKLDGNIILDKGVIRFNDPLRLEMPSGRMSMQGTINTLDETIDASLVATLPVGSNLPWVAALVGNLPAAAGVYLMSKVLSKQVDRLSSISYDITGGWDEPDISVGEIFAADQKAVEVESQANPQPPAVESGGEPPLQAPQNSIDPAAESEPTGGGEVASATADAEPANPQDKPETERDTQGEPL